MQGRIQNRGLIKAAANDLNVEGVKRFPAVLDLGDVKAVYVLGGRMGQDMCSLAKFNGIAGESIAGLGAYSVPIIGGSFVNPLFGAELTGDAEIAQFSIQVTYDSAGSSADAGAPLGLMINRSAKYDSLDQVQCVFLDAWQTVSSNQLLYAWNLGNYIARAPLSSDNRTVVGDMGSRIIPQGDELEVYVYRTAGGTWPANTVLKVQMTVFTAECQIQAAWAPLP